MQPVVTQMEELGLQQWKRGHFLCGPCRGAIWKRIGATELVVS
jgi:hypothetical protein